MKIIAFQLWLVGGCTMLSLLMASCSSPRDRTISPAEAKGMVLRYLSRPEAAKLGKWVTDSRTPVEKDDPSCMADGTIIVGPWVVDPTKKTVNLAIQRAELNGTFSRANDEYVIDNVAVTEIHGRGVKGR